MSAKVRIQFVELRIKLDEAITYGNFTRARKLAGEGLRKAKDAGLLGELEYFKSQIEILNENYSKAIMHLDEAVKYNPHDGAAFNDRALCMVELCKIDEAFAYFDKGISAEPDYATVYHNKGWLLNKTGRYNEAIEYFNQALALEPARAVTYENLADAMINLSRYSRAMEALRKAIDCLKPQYRSIKRQILARMESLK